MQLIEIKRWDNDEVIYSAQAETLKDAIEAAVTADVNLWRARLDGARLVRARLVGARLVGALLDGASLDGASLVGARLDGARLDGASLVGARLDGASLDGASLVGARLDGARLDGASLVRARLDGASLDGASLDGARLDRIKFDFFGRLTSLWHEVPGLRDALVNGRVDGSTYDGECACFIGTVANLRKCEVDSITEVTKDAGSNTECFFMAIRKGDTPENNQVSKIVVGWIDEWAETMKAATGSRLFNDKTTCPNCNISTNELTRGVCPSCCEQLDKIKG